MGEGSEVYRYVLVVVAGSGKTRRDRGASGMRRREGMWIGANEMGKTRNWEINGMVEIGGDRKAKGRRHID